MYGLPVPRLPPRAALMIYHDLSRSEYKYPSNCGWPAFFAAKIDLKDGEETVNRREDNSLGMQRIEVTCRKVSER